MAHEDNLSIGVFIDGGYYAKIDEGLAKKNMGKVNVKGLFQYIPEIEAFRNRQETDLHHGSALLQRTFPCC